jgi:hypothetical protein
MQHIYHPKRTVYFSTEQHPDIESQQIAPKNKVQSPTDAFFNTGILPTAKRISDEQVGEYKARNGEEKRCGNASEILPS